MSGPELLSWGRFPRVPQVAHGCHWRQDLPQHLAAVSREQGTTLVYGAGRSYGDSCLSASGHVLHTQRLDRFIAADWTTGVISAECGVTLRQILQVAIPRGWFLSVTPGTQYVTLGGAIANDVHGKNHHRRGTFGCHVRRFGLLRSDRGRLTCTTDENAELFCATIGGLGLTGILEWAEIQLMPIASSDVVSVHSRFGNLDEFFALSQQLDDQHEFSVSWVDCLSQGQSAGRGVYSAGDFAVSGPLQLGSPRTRAVPFEPPFSLVNTGFVRMFNEAYWRRAPAAPKQTRTPFGPFFYPLDAISQWNRIYGRAGFQQYQASIPEGQARDGVRSLLTQIARSGCGSFLAVLKRFGDVRSPGLLSFPQPGITLALDFPNSPTLSSALFPRLDTIVREAGGRLYPAKDAHMTPQDFRFGYPAWQQVEAMRDPAMMSSFWKRVTA